MLCLPSTFIMLLNSKMALSAVCEIRFCRYKKAANDASKDDRIKLSSKLTKTHGIFWTGDF